MTEAEEKFNKGFQDCHILIEFIKSEMEAFKNTDRPIDWGHVGSMNHFRESLKKTLMNMMGWKSEEECSRTIEEAIEDCYYEGGIR